MHEDLIATGLIGTDEAGKGDYFGPLVVAACYLNDKIHAELTGIGVRDSKKIANGRVKKLAASIKNLCPFNLIVIGPDKYNQLYAKMKNLNRLLAWAHAKAIENLLQKVDCDNVLTDQFGKEQLVLNALQEKGQKIKLIQRHKAEINPAVAAASIIARAEFLFRLESLSKTHGVDLHAGAGAPTDQAIVRFVQKHGQDKLNQVAKTHFKNTKKVLG
ncbi:MAG: ribonuclease HIII [candidate division Zixibacteria bacterium]|nr:ribonuclease HIII [candidate division Zixibacteria bacterium]